MAGDEPVAQDYDGDGKTDCAIVRRVNGQLQWWIFRSSISDPAIATIVYSYGLASDSPVAGDYDGDGRYDLALQRQVGNTLEFHVSCPTSQINFAIQWGYKTDISVPADYDGDGITDIAICRFIGTEDLAEWWIQRSSDDSVNVFRFGTYTETFHDIPIPADYDGDGYADLAVWRIMSPVAKFYIRKTSDNQDLILDFGVFGDIPIGSHTVR